MNDGSGAWADVRKWIPQWGQFLGAPVQRELRFGLLARGIVLYSWNI